MTRLAWGRTFGVLSQLAAIGLLLVSAWLIVRAAEQPPVLYLMVAIVAVRFFGLSRAALRYVERLLTHDVALARVTEARVAAYRDLDRVAPVGVPGRRRGDLVSRVVSDVDAVQDRMLRLRSPWIVALASSLLTIALLVVVDPVSGLVVGVCTAVVLVLVRLVVPRAVRRSGDRSSGWRGDLAADVSHGVVAAPDLVAYGATDLLRASAHRSIDLLSDAQRRTSRLAGVGEAIVLLGAGVAVAAVAALSGGLDPVLVGVVVLAPLALVEPLTAVADAEGLRPGIEDAERRLAELAETSEAVVDPARPGGAPSGFELELEGLAIGWDSTLVSGIDLVVPEGGVVAVRGPSGSGKSTLALTIARLIEPRAGTVRLGGVDVRTLAASDVRSTIGYLGQDEIVFDTTIRENLRIADPSATDDELLAALGRAGLGDFVRSLPDGLDTEVGERGGRLSGGERQRLCLARLVLGGHRVLVLDEPTEHLDERAGDALLDDVLALGPGRSIVVVTHSPRVLDRIDEVLTIGARGPLAAASTPGR
ncbi:thiol reductant ABC exporter subunit CydC [Aeromicrobium sp. CFBP 8757]|uniref:thiol reductant ABC exporter subunit CydC n=1 Tax=Aeromicrobium sp. CFBP 8757 TaxID=2775288 RepID=UPI0017833130|nr:thiol reductant ABC exporter subunit CydC [Aeromicrobium sp. CFBP 8757]MBD8608100.1 thiol reductant ABC exporter subunit CydC [Aeromicrobium sp. CFBP 8757]